MDPCEKYGTSSDLDAAFIDENGDKVYVKNNYLFWREYGVMRQKSVQKYLKCRKPITKVWQQ